MLQLISTQKIHRVNHGSSTHDISVIPLLHKFIAWCGTQEKNRLLWLAVSLLGGIGTVLPFTLLSIVFGADNNFNLWLTAIIINVPILVVNLAAQPTKIILPVVFFAYVTDAVIIVYCMTLWFMK